MPSEHAQKEKHKPAFRRIMADLSKGTVLKPLIHSYLFEAQFPDFSVDFRKIGPRKPDGKFHPSEHPLWPERMLWWYLTAPDQIVVEPKEYMGTLSVTIGTVMHEFMRMCLWDLGIALTVEEMRAEGWSVPKRSNEARLDDEQTGAAGSMDGILKLMIPSHPQLARQHFEYKTSNPAALQRFDDLDLAYYMKRWPGYYAQNQEYMRMSGLRLSIVLFMAMGYPWESREIHVPYDPHFSEDVRQKYIRVREAERDGMMPDPCCGPGSKDSKVCPARMVCPNGTRG